VHQCSVAASLHTIDDYMVLSLHHTTSHSYTWNCCHALQRATALLDLVTCSVLCLQDFTPSKLTAGILSEADAAAPAAAPAAEQQSSDHQLLAAQTPALPAPDADAIAAEEAVEDDAIPTAANGEGAEDAPLQQQQGWGGPAFQFISGSSSSEEADEDEKSEEDEDALQQQQQQQPSTSSKAVAAAAAAAAAVAADEDVDEAAVEGFPRRKRRGIHEAAAAAAAAAEAAEDDDGVIVLSSGSSSGGGSSGGGSDSDGGSDVQAGDGGSSEVST
jgi:hypothetical protein